MTVCGMHLAAHAFNVVTCRRCGESNSIAARAAFSGSWTSLPGTRSEASITSGSFGTLAAAAFWIG